MVNVLNRIRLMRRASVSMLPKYVRRVQELNSESLPFSDVSWDPVHPRSSVLMVDYNFKKRFLHIHLIRFTHFKVGFLL